MSVDLGPFQMPWPPEPALENYSNKKKQSLRWEVCRTITTATDPMGTVPAVQTYCYGQNEQSEYPWQSIKEIPQRFEDCVRKYHQIRNGDRHYLHDGKAACVQCAEIFFDACKYAHGVDTAFCFDHHRTHLKAWAAAGREVGYFDQPGLVQTKNGNMPSKQRVALRSLDLEIFRMTAPTSGPMPNQLANGIKLWQKQNQDRADASAVPFFTLVTFLKTVWKDQESYDACVMLHNLLTDGDGRSVDAAGVPISTRARGKLWIDNYLMMRGTNPPNTDITKLATKIRRGSTITGKVPRR